MNRLLSKHTSTSNEFLARKKNVSEEVKLRQALASLDCKKSLTKDALRQDVGKVKNELRQLRRSTGHSIEALPPTPFRLLMARRYSLMPAAPPQPNDPQFACVSPEFYYMLDEFFDDDEGDVMGNLDGAPNLPTVNDNLNNVWQNTPSDRRGSMRLVTFFDGPEDSQTEILAGSRKSASREDELCREYSRKLPQLPQKNIADHTLTKSLLNVPARDTSILQMSELTLPLLADYHRKMSESPLSQRSASRLSVDPSPVPTQSDFNYGDTRNREFASPVSKKLISILSEGEWKRREYVRKNSVAGFDSFAAKLVTQRAMNDPTAKDSLGRNKEDNHISSKSKDKELRAYRDARTRCRTCMQRFRQNAAFQKQKLEQEIIAATQVKLLEDKRGSMANVWLQKNTASPSSDFDPYSSDDVLDFDDRKEKPISHGSQQKGKLKGYSRKRLNELAEPRKGTRRKTLFSKRLIAKEMDTLTKTHDHPQLTDRERERLRMLESKIRTFLATMGQILRPASMVHIPQREDIMKVDISHH
ncbi:hypothetical protein ElyMa_002639900 [Elysia marginata]|uniref:BZIP domain-containing protein n=1 Tax=Elysia marginata TaxID=1093978 RepID=A0AAV4H9R1_9GAST|nr:hypothetical protein ElyMa_002639900 [Elysia marginata]